MKYITTEIVNGIFRIGFNRPDLNNAFNMQMVMELSEAYTQYEDNADCRCAIVFAHGKHFTVGLEIDEVAEYIRKEGGIFYPNNQVDPFGIVGRIRKKPVIIAIQGFCFTLGIELALASDIRLGTKSARFTQAEVTRGIAAFGGATFRMQDQFGWGNAMRYLLTGDVFGGEEAYRVGLIQEIVDAKELLNRAQTIAETIANNAPLAVLASLESAIEYRREAEIKAFGKIQKRVLELLETEDGKEGIRSFQEKRKANFQGK